VTVLARGNGPRAAGCVAVSLDLEKPQIPYLLIHCRGFEKLPLYAHAGIKASGAVEVVRPMAPSSRLRFPLLGLYGLFETELEFFQSRLLRLALLLDGCSFYLTQMQRRY
jgi:hypothetical protein